MTKVHVFEELDLLSGDPSPRARKSSVKASIALSDQILYKHFYHPKLLTFHKKACIWFRILCIRIRDAAPYHKSIVTIH